MCQDIRRATDLRVWICVAFALVAERGEYSCLAWIKPSTQHTRRVLRYSLLKTIRHTRLMKILYITSFTNTLLLLYVCLVLLFLWSFTSYIWCDNQSRLSRRFFGPQATRTFKFQRKFDDRIFDVSELYTDLCISVCVCMYAYIRSLNLHTISRVFVSLSLILSFWLWVCLKFKYFQCVCCESYINYSILKLEEPEPAKVLYFHIYDYYRWCY